MNAIIDIAKHFKIFIPTKAELHSFDMPSQINFTKDNEQNVEVTLSKQEKGSFSVSVNSKYFSGFSPHEDLEEAFKDIFRYYFFHTAQNKLAGENLKRVNIIFPLTYSLSFENLLYKIRGDEYDVTVYRDIDVYAAYYFERSRDLPELKRYAQDDGSAHVFGIITHDNLSYIVLINFTINSAPEIIDFTLIDQATDLFETLKLFIKKNSTEKKRVFFFLEGEPDNIPDLFQEGSCKKNLQVEIEKGKSIPARMLRKKNTADAPILSGVEVLNDKPSAALSYKLFLYFQKSRTTFAPVPLDKELKITADFPKNVPREFFINFFIGPNPSNLILFNRVFVDTGAIMDKHIDFKGKLIRMKDQLKLNLIYKDKINKETIFGLSSKYKVS